MGYCPFWPNGPVPHIVTRVRIVTTCRALPPASVAALAPKFPPPRPECLREPPPAIRPVRPLFLRPRHIRCGAPTHRPIRPAGPLFSEAAVRTAPAGSDRLGGAQRAAAVSPSLSHTPPAQPLPHTCASALALTVLPRFGFIAEATRPFHPWVGTVATPSGAGFTVCVHGSDSCRVSESASSVLPGLLSLCRFCDVSGPPRTVCDDQQRTRGSDVTGTSSDQARANRMV